jgi:hypothetical protein
MPMQLGGVRCLAGFQFDESCLAAGERFCPQWPIADLDNLERALARTCPPWSISQIPVNVFRTCSPSMFVCLAKSAWLRF